MHPNSTPSTGRSLSAWLAVLGGGDLSILDDCPHDRAVAVRTGVNICSVALVAAVSAAFMLHMAFHLGPIASVLGGTAWGGLVIVPLDALLVAVLRRQHRVALTVALAVPRLLLAAVIAFVVGVPLSLQVFAPEINAQVKLDQQSAEIAYQRELSKNPEFAAIPRLETEIGHLEQVEQADAPPDIDADPAVRADQARVDSLQAEYAKAEQTVGCEADGTCGTHQVGDGPATTADQAVAAELKAELGEAQDQLGNAEAAAAKDSSAAAAAARSLATSELPGLNNALRSAEREKTHLIAAEASTVKASTGLAARMQALAELSSSYPEVRLFHLALVLLAAGIETVPILTKTLSLLGKPSVAETLSDIRNNDLVERRRTEAEQARQLDLELFEGRRRVAVDAQEALYDDLYSAWADTVRAEFKSDPSKFII